MSWLLDEVVDESDVFGRESILFFVILPHSTESKIQNYTLLV